MTAGGRGTTGLSVQGEARVWSVATGKAVTEGLEHPAEVTSAVFSPDGRRLLTACGQAVSGRGEARVWEIETGRLVGRPMEHALQVIEAAFSPDGRLVVTASNDATARVWDADTGEPRTAPLRHGDRLTAAAFSPDGRRVLTAGRDGTARIWDAETGDAVGPTLHHGQPVTTAAFAPDGRRVATATLGGVVRVWDLAVALPRLHLRHDRIVLGVASSADGKYLVSAPGQRGSVTTTGPGLAVARESHTITQLALWDTISGKSVAAMLPHSGPWNAASLSPDGRLVLTISSAGGRQPGTAVRLWQLANGNPEGRPFIRPLVLAAGFASDGRPLAVSATTKSKVCEVQVWDTVRDTAIGPPLAHPANVNRAALSADGRTVATVSRDRLIRIWDVSEGRLLYPPLTSTQPVHHLEFSPDCSRLLTLAGSLGLSRPDEGSALLWNLREGRALPLQHGDRVVQAVFSAEGMRVATAGADGTARIWAATDGRPLTPPLRHDAGLTQAAFSRDGLMLATAARDRTARLWDAHTGEPLGPPLVHSDTVTAVAFTSGGRHLATACMDGGVRTWALSRDPRSPTQLFVLAQLLAGSRLDDSGGLTALETLALKTAWREGRLAQSESLTVSPQHALAWHLAEAEAAQRKKQWLGVAFHVGKQIAAEPKESRHHVRRAQAQAELGHWAEAAADFAHAMDLGDANNDTARGLALSRLAAGQRNGYKAACAALLKKLDRVEDATNVQTLAQTLVLDPDAVNDHAGLLEATAKLDGRRPRGWKVWDVHSAVLFRAGKSEEAAERLTRLLKENPNMQTPWNWLLLALVRQRQGQTRVSAEWLQKATESLDGPSQLPAAVRRRRILPWQRLSWEERLELTLLRREAEEALRGGHGRPVEIKPSTKK